VTVNTLVRSNASVAWFILTALTVVSWTLGTQHGFGGDNHVPASLVIFTVAIFKIRLVGLYFMELRAAPLALRGIFEGYCVVLFGLLTGMYLLA
jgi:Prokaryotic Cytochrome C oxidase subunit IV